MRRRGLDLHGLTVIGEEASLLGQITTSVSGLLRTVLRSEQGQDARLDIAGNGTVTPRAHCRGRR